MLPPLFRQFRYLWEYTPLAKDLVHAMKYRPSYKLGKWTGEALGRAAPRLFTRFDWDVITAIPSSAKKLRERGFNQCVLMAKALRDMLLRESKRSFPLDFAFLEHSGEHMPQAQVKHEDRMRNVTKAFRVNSKRVLGKKILLIDDVVTTGSTTAAATLALLNAGAECVDVLALCRSTAWIEYRHEVAKQFRLR